LLLSIATYQAKHSNAEMQDLAFQSCGCRLLLWTHHDTSW